MTIPTTAYIEPRQGSKIKTALRKQKGCRIKMEKPDVGYTNCKKLLKGEILLNPSQWKKYQKAEPGKSIAIPFQHKHLVNNMNHKGGILPLLLAFLTPLVGGIAGGLIEREIATSGSGIRPQKLILCNHFFLY